jgi:mediator of RNA polymerase II transcription subunit 8
MLFVHSNGLSFLFVLLANLVMKIDTDQNFNWASFLDSYSLISGQLNLLLKTVKSDKTPQLSRYIVVPRILTMDRDDELSGLTENRVDALRHDLVSNHGQFSAVNNHFKLQNRWAISFLFQVPNYLRTKPDPGVESRYSSYEQISYNLPSQEAAIKMLNVLDKVTKDTTKIISREKDDLDTRMPHKK